MKLLILFICSILYFQEVSAQDKAMRPDLFVSYTTDSSSIKAAYEEEWLEGLLGLKDHYYYWTKSGIIYRTEYGFDGKPLHGIYKEYYKDGKLKMMGSLTYGLKDGLWKEWYNNGSIMKVENYNLGLLNGEMKKWNLENVLVYSGTYKNGIKNGKFVLVSDSEVVFKKYKNGLVLIPRKTLRQKLYEVKNRIKKKSVQNSPKQTCPDANPVAK